MVELSQNPTGASSVAASVVAAVLLVAALGVALVGVVVATGVARGGCVVGVGLTSSERSAKLKTPRAAAESAMTVRAPTAIPEARFMT